MKRLLFVALLAMGMLMDVGRAQAQPKSTLCQSGGNCFLTRDYAIDTQIRPYGKVIVRIRDRFTQKLMHQGLSLRALIPTRVGKRLVDIRWDPFRQFFMGFLPAGVRPAQGSVNLQVHSQRGVQRASALAAVTPHAIRGGVVIAAGPHAFEVLPYDNGQVEAAYMGSSPSALSGARVSVLLRASNDQALLAQLRYSRAHKLFLGKVNVEQSPLITGPIELEVQDAGKHYRGSVAMAKPLGQGDMEGWQFITGPYTIEVAKTAGAKLAAIVRNARGLACSSQDIHLEVNLHSHAEGVEADSPFTLPLRFNAYRMRFEGTIPETARSFVWIDATVVPLKDQPQSDYPVKWNGSIRM